MKNRIIDVQNVKITISKEELDDYICITDIAKAKSEFCQSGRCSAKLVEKSWNIRISVCSGNIIYNPEFKVFESEHFKKQAGLYDICTPSVSEWINKTNAIGLYVKRGKYGGTYAHKDHCF